MFLASFPKIESWNKDTAPKSLLVKQNIKINLKSSAQLHTFTTWQTKGNLLKTQSQMNASGVKNAIRFKDTRSFFLPFGFPLNNFQHIYSYFSPIASQGFWSWHLILNAIHIHKHGFISLITTAINFCCTLFRKTGKMEVWRATTIKKVWKNYNFLG